MVSDSKAVDELSKKVEEWDWTASTPEEGKLVEAMTKLDDEYLQEKDAFDAEVLKIELGYRKKWGAILEKRSALLAEKRAAVPKFWLTVLKHCDATCDAIEEYDEPVLEYLTDMRTEWLDDSAKTGFKLIFEFAENPFFDNTTVVKIYRTSPFGKFTDDLEIDEIECEELEWKKGKNVTIQKVQKKSKKGRKGNAKAVMVEESVPSFFRVFFRSLDPDMELSDEEEDEDDEDPDYNPTEMIMQDDWETGCVLRDCVIPFAVRWYTGEACPEDEEHDEEEYEDDSEEEDSEEDSDGESPPPKTKAKGKGKGKNDEDCKNQ